MVSGGQTFVIARYRGRDTAEQALARLVELEDEGERGEFRDEVLRRVHANGVRAHVHYPLLHRQPVLSQDSSDQKFPVATRYERRALTLPLYPGLEEHAIDRVVEALADAIHGVRKSDPALPLAN